jgi:LacI family transcriptional regulator
MSSDVEVRNPPATIRRVAVLVETSTSWGSLIIAGVSDYIRRHHASAQSGRPRWTIYVDTRGYFERQELPAWWTGDGIIARVTSPLLVQQVRMGNLPCVNVSQICVPGARIQQVTSNQAQIGALAAETLIKTGAKHFAYHGPPAREFYTDEVSRAFVETVKRAGFATPVLFDPDRSLRSDNNPHDMLQPLAQWLTDLPKPAAVLAWNFLGGQRVCEAACYAGIDVPRELSVLSADYDQLIGDICDPPLTCVDQSPRQVGYLAAAELDRLMGGGDVESPRLVNPGGVVWKQSVLTGHISDELVSQAIDYIRANLTRDVTVDELCEHLGSSRRKIELHFRRAIGHGPVTHLQRLRLSEACRLLAETNLLVKQIVLKSGFRNAEQLQRLLKSETGMTPQQYRESHRRPPIGSAPPAVVAIERASSRSARPDVLAG